MIARTLSTIIVALVCAILIAIVFVLKLSFSADQIGGFVVGIVASVIAAFGWFWLNDWIGTATSPGRPQTIRLQTDDTPSQITWAAIRAIIKLSLVCVALVFIFLSIMGRLLGVDVLVLLQS